MIEQIYDIDYIKLANKNQGHFFFSPDTMRFFGSRVSSKVYQGKGGVFFVTSELDFQGENRFYNVRQFIPESGEVNGVGEFNQLNKYEAHRLAKHLSKIGYNE